MEINEFKYEEPIPVNNENNNGSNGPMNYNGNNNNNKGSGIGVGKVIVLILFTAIISVLIGAGSLLLVFHFFPDFARDTVTNITKTEKEVTVTDTGIADAVEKVYNSVVVVKTYQRNQLYATGTGFVYKHEGNKYYLLTNYHVIQSGDSVGVVFTDGSEEKVTLEGGDRYADIAVLSIDTTKEIQVAEIGSSVDMRVGDTVFAIGAPLDYSVYSWSVTRGILSGKDREVEVSTSGYQSDWIMQVLQTDAAINNGNSGGPLCNSNGQVIGINNMKLASTGIEGMGFSIPIEEATSYADALIKGENISRPYIGISMAEASNVYNAYNYGVTATDGVIVVEVSSGSPAEAAGLKANDVITELNGTAVSSIASLRYELYKYKSGDTITIKYMRNNKVSTTKLTLTSSE